MLLRTFAARFTSKYIPNTARNSDADKSFGNAGMAAFIGGISVGDKLSFLRFHSSFLTSITGPDGSLHNTSRMHVCNQLVICNPDNSFWFGWAALAQLRISLI